MFEKTVRNEYKKIRLRDEKISQKAKREGYKRVRARRKEADSLPIAGRAYNIRKQMNYNKRNNIGI